MVRYEGARKADLDDSGLNSEKDNHKSDLLATQSVDQLALMLVE